MKKELGFLAFVLLFAIVRSCTYTIKSGDTLSGVATAQNCLLNDILNANPGINANNLQVGQVIQLPTTCSSCSAPPPPPPAVIQCVNNPLPLTLEQLTKILPDLATTFTGQAAPYCDVHTPASLIDPLNQMLNDYNITTPLRIAAFLAQVGHESADLRCWEENPAFTGKCSVVTANDYSGTCLFRGRGPIQLTNDYNYNSAQTYLKTFAGYAQDIVTNPDLVKTDILIGFRTSGWFWSQNALVNGAYTNLNIVADESGTDCTAFARMTAGIQGGCQVDSQTSRVARYCNARKVFGLDLAETSCGYENFPCPGTTCVSLTARACVDNLSANKGIASPGTIAGAVIGSVLAVAVVASVVVVVILVKKRKIRLDRIKDKIESWRPSSRSSSAAPRASVTNPEAPSWQAKPAPPPPSSAPPSKPVSYVQPSRTNTVSQGSKPLPPPPPGKKSLPPVPPKH